MNLALLLFFVLSSILLFVLYVGLLAARVNQEPPSWMRWPGSNAGADPPSQWSICRFTSWFLWVFGFCENFRGLILPAKKE